MQNHAARNLAIIRILYFSLIYWLIARYSYFEDWQNVPTEFWFPTGPMSFFSAPPLPSALHTLLFHLWRWLLVICALGLLYRWLAPVTFIFGFILFNYAHSFGYQTHTYMPVLLAGLPLAFARASDTLSLDRFFGNPKPETAIDLRIYTWHVKSMQLVFCLTFFAAGVSKLRFGGMEWIFSDTLRNYFYRASIIYSDMHPLAHAIGLNRILYEHPIFTRVLAMVAVIIEFSAPLALWKQTYARVIVPMLFVMQIFIFFTIFVNFQIYLTIYIAWIPWGEIYDFLRSRSRVVFDPRAGA